MTALAPIGLVALGFALVAFYSADRFGPFGWANLVGGALALAAAAAGALRDARRQARSRAARRVLARRLAGVALALAAAVAAERALARCGLAYDATAERRYTLSPATRAALSALPGPLSATLYYDVEDGRVRSTRLLLGEIARAGRVEVRERLLEEAAAEADRYGIGSSNSVVLRLDGRSETVERPTEGTLYEALRRLLREGGRVIYVARGEGEGSFVRTDAAGFSGFGAALETEGYELRELVVPALEAVPPDAALLLFVAPRRGLPEPALAALGGWLDAGGRLVALLEPGTATGLEELLGRFGFELPDAVVVDPASGRVEGAPPGVNPIVFQYAAHPVVAGLDGSRMTFFLRARPVVPARKPEAADELRALAFSSRRAWLAPNVAAVERGLAPERPADAREDYWPLLAIGRYPRPAGEARIAVFGDADFASNRYLRALYNLDLALNAVHWAAEREASITLRPKALTPDQFPLTPQQSLAMLYGVGLLVPELCLIAAALAWWRRRRG